VGPADTLDQVSLLCKPRNAAERWLSAGQRPGPLGLIRVLIVEDCATDATVVERELEQLVKPPRLRTAADCSRQITTSQSPRRAQRTVHPRFRLDGITSA